VVVFGRQNREEEEEEEEEDGRKTGRPELRRRRETRYAKMR
jgi:hypothetical protein